MAKHKLHFDTYCSVSEVLNTAHERLCSFCGALFCKRSLVKTQAETGQRSTFDQLTASGFTNKIQESYSLMHKNLAFLFMSDYWIIVFLRLTVAFFWQCCCLFWPTCFSWAPDTCGDKVWSKMLSFPYRNFWLQQNEPRKKKRAGYGFHEILVV